MLALGRCGTNCGGKQSKTHPNGGDCGNKRRERTMTPDEEQALLRLVVTIARTPAVKRHLRRQAGVCRVCGDKGTVSCAGSQWDCPQCRGTGVTHAGP